MTTAQVAMDKRHKGHHDCQRADIVVDHRPTTHTYSKLRRGVSMRCSSCDRNRGISTSAPGFNVDDDDEEDNDDDDEEDELDLVGTVGLVVNSAYDKNSDRFQNWKHTTQPATTHQRLQQ